MKIRRKPYAEPEIILASLIDIAFLLLIFFILTTTFIKTAGNKLAVPSGSLDSSKKEERQLTINLKPGDIRWGEKAEQITIEDLRAELKKEDFASKDPAKRVVIVDASQDVVYDEYFQVVMAIAKAGGVMALVEQQQDDKATAAVKK